MVDCDKFKVTWFDRPVPNIFGLLNIFNFDGSITGFPAVLPVVRVGKYSNVVNSLQLVVEPKCWFKTNK